MKTLNKSYIPYAKKPTSTGGRIAYFRCKSGLTQSELGSIIGVSRSLITALETNKRNATKFIKPIAMALHVNESDLLGTDVFVNDELNDAIQLYSKQSLLIDCIHLLDSIVAHNLTEKQLYQISVNIGLAIIEIEGGDEE